MKALILLILVVCAGCGESGRCTAQNSESVTKAPQTHLCEGGICK